MRAPPRTRQPCRGRSLRRGCRRRCRRRNVAGEVSARVMVRPDRFIKRTRVGEQMRHKASAFGRLAEHAVRDECLSSGIQVTASRSPRRARCAPTACATRAASKASPTCSACETSARRAARSGVAATFADRLYHSAITSFGRALFITLGARSARRDRHATAAGLPARSSSPGAAESSSGGYRPNGRRIPARRPPPPGLRAGASFAYQRHARR